MAEETPFGRYRLIELLGRGGMGEVWRAFDTETQRVVAVKVLPPNMANDPSYEERFRREALAAAGLNDPHVVPIHNFGEIEGRLYVDMRLINGKDLQAIIAEGVLEPRRAVTIIEQIASALFDAHRIGLVHRDVKPSNILVGENDFAYLIDFGIARSVGETRMTGTGNVIGTWAYMPPERISNGQTDPRGDTYALACVLHECLTGSQPFPGNSLEQQIGGHLSLPPPRPSALRNELPPALDAVIATGMAKDPAQRYSTVVEMARAARSAVSDAPTVPAPVWPPSSVHFAAAETQFAGPPDTPQNYQPALGGSPADATRYGQPGDHWVYGTRPPGSPGGDFRPDAPPMAPDPNRKWRRIALASAAALVVVIAVVAGFVLTNAGKSSQPTGGGHAKTALPNTGPFTGTFTAKFGAKLSSTGKEVQGAQLGENETWYLRSACNAGGCAATALRSSGALNHPTSLVFDDIGDRWIAVTVATVKCKDQDVEEWNLVWLDPRPNGGMAGEWISDAIGCYSKRPVTFNRTGDTDVASLTDPATQPARVASPALGLHGVYHEVVTFPGGKYKPQDSDNSVATFCLRAGDRCISRFLRTDGSGIYELMIYTNGAWTRTSEFDTPCPAGGTAHTVINGVFPLPKPAPDPIPQLSGNGHKELSGSSCKSTDYAEVFNRTGD